MIHVLTCSGNSYNLTPKTVSCIITDTKTISIGLVLIQASEHIAFGKAT